MEDLSAPITVNVAARPDALHILRVVAARWLEQPPVEAARYYLSTATVSVLARERETPVIDRWNEACHLDGL